MLIPMLKKIDLAKRDNPKIWAENILNECKTALNRFLPLSKSEIEFYNKLLEHGEVDATLLTDDEILQARISQNPAIQWKAVNVREYKSKAYNDYTAKYNALHKDYHFSKNRQLSNII